MKHLVDTLGTPNIRDLLAYTVTLDLNSMTGAAKNLGESKGSISRRLSRLEEQLGVKLVCRSARGVVATEIGAAYHHLVKRALNMLGEAASLVVSATEPKGWLRISVSHGFGLQVLGGIIGRFAVSHPDLQIQVTLEDHPQLNGDDVDVAIHPDWQVGDFSVSGHRLVNWEMRFVASPDYLRQHPFGGEIQQLAQHPIFLGGVRGPIVTNALRENASAEPLRLDPTITSESTSFVRQAVLAGSGIAFIPSITVNGDIANGQLVDLLPDTHFQDYEGAMYFLYAASATVPPKIALFRDFMIAEMRRRAPLEKL